MPEPLPLPEDLATVQRGPVDAHRVPAGRAPDVTDRALGGAAAAAPVVREDADA